MLNRKSSIQLFLIYYCLYQPENLSKKVISILLFLWGLPISEEDGYNSSLHKTFVTLGEIMHSDSEVELQCLNYLQESCLSFSIKLYILTVLALNYPVLLTQLPQFLSAYSKQYDIIIVYCLLFRLKRDKQEFLRFTEFSNHSNNLKKLSSEQQYDNIISCLSQFVNYTD